MIHDGALLLRTEPHCFPRPPVADCCWTLDTAAQRWWRRWNNHHRYRVSSLQVIAQPLCKLLLISDFRSFDHLLVSYPSFTYLDFHVNILKRFYFHKIYCLVLSMNSHDNADSSISPCCGNVKNCHFSGVLPDGNWKYGKFAALLHNTSALDYSWYCQFLCISSVSVQWDVNIAK